MMCELATITIDVNQEGRMLVVPAFTQSVPRFRSHIAHVLKQYLEWGSYPSTADFAFYLLALAQNEPREMPDIEK